MHRLTARRLPSTLLLFALTCCSAHNASVSVPVSSIRVYTGNGVEFNNQPCVNIDANDDSEASDVVKRDIIRELRNGGILTSAQPCAPTNRFVMRVAYNTGIGVCIDCTSASKLGARTGFAFISIESQDASQIVAAAEWHYWGGGSSRQAIRTFGKDVSRMARRN